MGDLVSHITTALRGFSGWWGVLLSLALIVGSMVLATAVVLSWPANRFQMSGRPAFMQHRHPVLRAVGLAIKNLFGVVLLLLGAIMALPGVPGQGLLIMVIGLTLVDFPGKRRFERRIISNPSVLKVVNGVRARFHRPSLELD